MIDFGEKLLTFELRELPKTLGEGATQVLDVTRLADHRRHYLDFEGPLAADASGGERGNVQRVAAGSAACHASDATGTVRLQLTAAELRAEVEFRPCAVGGVTQLLFRHCHWCAA